MLGQQVVTWLAPCRGIYVDATLGAGGHAELLLHAQPDCHVLGIDRDGEACHIAEHRLAGYGDRVRVVQGRMSDLVDILTDRLPNSWSGLATNGVIMDLGVSSMQLDQAQRGFSLQRDGRLDMRMDSASTTMDAAELVNRASERELADIFYHYGEERKSRHAARAIIAARKQAPITRTNQLADLLRARLGGPGHHRIHPATRCFQALRIYVNDELTELQRGLAACRSILPGGGKLAVIAFHSLEDRIVKQEFRDGGKDGPWQPLFRKPIRADAAELHTNRRSRSAKLRVATRTEEA